MPCSGLIVGLAQARLPPSSTALVAPPWDAEPQVRLLAERGVTHTSLWVVCGAQALNSKMVLEAEAEVVRKDAAATAVSQLRRAVRLRSRPALRRCLCDTTMTN
jgi:hypothetical protein